MEPITRSEMLMDGQYVEPITRKEMILAGEDLEPVTREEYFLKKYRHSGGDVDVVQLTATENKTYTAPEGKAYNPVKVNIPEPVLDSITINENGHFTPPAGTDGYDDITVYVPYVTQGTTINENGDYTPPSGVDGFGRVIVDVPTPPPSLQSLTASHNGHFVPSSGYVGFSEVTVDVATPLETLSATENGTYTPSSGYEGFSEVTVDVPLPNNAYLLESQKNDVVSIQHGAEFDMPKLIASIEPQQSGSGDPSPTNIRPISGWDEVNVGISGGEDILDLTQASNVSKNEYGATITFNSDNSVTINGTTTGQSQIVWTFAYSIVSNFKGKFLAGINDCTLIIEQASSPYTKWAIVEDGDVGKVISENINTTANLIIRIPAGKTFNNRVIKPIIYDVQTITLDLDGTRYGGKLDVVSGVMTVDKASIKLNDLNWTKQNTANNNWRFKSSQSIQNIKIPTSAAYKIDNLCSVYRNVTANETWTADDTGIAVNADASLFICDLNQADTTALGAVIANQTYCYELATPQTYQLTPTQVKSLLGVNNIWADTGEVDVQIWTKEV